MIFSLKPEGGWQTLAKTCHSAQSRILHENQQPGKVAVVIKPGDEMTPLNQTVKQLQVKLIVAVKLTKSGLKADLMNRYTDYLLRAKGSGDSGVAGSAAAGSAAAGSASATVRSMTAAQTTVSEVSGRKMLTCSDADSSVQRRRCALQ